MVYCIDDDKSVRRSFEMFLKSAGIAHKSFESAEEFLSHFRPDRKTLLILDMSLPGMNGFDLLKKFDKDGIDIPIIVVTAFEDSRCIEYCRKFGVKAYLRKPVDGDALIDLINYNLMEVNTKALSQPA